jgi:drug/metabolite transporter (DMT)-like permease
VYRPAVARERLSSEAVGVAAATATALLYGSSYVATAFALRSFTPLTAATWRGVVGCAAVGLVILVSRSPDLRPGRLTGAAVWRLLVLGAVGGPAFLICLNVAVSLAGASITAFVAGMYAVLVALLAIPVLGERPEARTLGALLLALLGAALLGQVQLGGSTALGVGVALLAACVFATYLVLIRRWSATHGLPGPIVGVSSMGLSVVVTTVLALGIGTGNAPLRADAVAAIAWLGLGPGALATILVVIGMRRLPARRASVLLLLNPPTAAVGAWLLLGERLDPVQIIGAALILVAMAAATGALRVPGPARRR